MAVDRRKKNINWNVADERGNMYNSVNAASLAMLLDIRDELQTLNKLLGCHNFVNLPQTLKGLRRDFAQMRREQKRS